MDRTDLVRRYRELVLAELPARGAAGGWILTQDHCFGRIVLDNVLQCCWYDVLDRRRSPAFLQLDDAQLAAAVALAERIATEGDDLVAELDAASRTWRGQPARPRRPR